MGSYHRQVAILVPDDKLDCYVLSDFFALDKNSLAFYLGLVLPHSPLLYRGNGNGELQ